MRVAYQKFEHWFETGQERSQEWFTTHARIITGMLGLVFAFWLQLDAMEIFKLVSSNREVRASLVAKVKTVTGQAEGILLDDKKNATTTLNKALKAWREDEIGKDDKANETAEKTLGKETVAAIKALTAKPDDGRDQVVKKVEDAVAKAPNKDDLNKHFVAKVGEQAKNDVEESVPLYKSVKGDLDKTGFDLFPKEGWRWMGEDWIGHRGEHFLGMIFSALLLSLGAPFWFNTLKSLASLRSSVAGNISDEKKEALEKGKANKPGTPPPTVVPPPPAKTA